MAFLFADTYCIILGVTVWCRRELPLFFQVYFVLSGILLHMIAILLVWGYR